VVSRLHLQSPTQCGFRPGHGALDAIFTLQHLIHSAQHHRQRLYVVFVDFKKAFDRVRRNLSLEPCRELGIHDLFLDLLVKLYDMVCCRVAVDGSLAEPIRTTSCTKQGGELSHLFCLFIELLHDMILLELQGASPVLDGLRFPDIMYADDVTLISSSPAEVQQLSDNLDVFCRIFSKSACLAVIYRDFHHIPSPAVGNATRVVADMSTCNLLPPYTRYVPLGCAWWTKMSQARQGEQSIACRAWVEDVQRARAGCATCWSGHPLHTLCSSPAGWGLAAGAFMGGTRCAANSGCLVQGRMISLMTHVSVLLGGSLCVSMRCGFILLAPRLISSLRPQPPPTPGCASHILN